MYRGECLHGAIRFEPIQQICFLRRAHALRRTFVNDELRGLSRKTCELLALLRSVAGLTCRAYHDV